METNIKTESKTTIETEAYFDNGILKSHNCELGEWWGEGICKEVKIKDELSRMNIPKGRYKISITLELVND